MYRFLLWLLSFQIANVLSAVLSEEKRSVDNMHDTPANTWEVFRLDSRQNFRIELFYSLHLT